MSENETRKQVKVSNVTITGYTSKVIVACPECSYKNNFFVHPASKFQAIRTCHGCGAILSFDVEEIKEVKDDSSKAGASL